jgi:uncharacterized membrane protein YozB (DUF420 family)
MVLYGLAGLSFLHAGTPVALSQLTLTVMLVALGVLLMGIGFGRLSKGNKQNLMQHRWTLTTAVVLTLGAVFLVMVPSFFNYYVDPDVQVFGSLSITTIIHAVIAVPAVVSALVYVFGDLPANVRKWMRLTAALWIAALVLGVVLFLQMLSLI